METDKTAASPPAPLASSGLRPPSPTGEGKGNDKFLGEGKNTAPELIEIVKFISDRFPPATDFQSSDIHMSTLELYNCINEFYPSEVYGPNDVFQLLKKAGYVYDVLDGMHFVWLLKKPSSP